MKKVIKLVLRSIPALVIAATVGSASGCGDDTATPLPDLSVSGGGPDMKTPPSTDGGGDAGH